MNDKFLPFLFCMIVCISLGLFVGKSYASDKQCTVTITDMQGIRHQITGVADNE